MDQSESKLTERKAMLVVDSNILAYLIIDGVRTSEARRLLDRDPDWHSERLALIELTNVLATAMRVRNLGLAPANAALAEGLDVIESGLHDLAHAEALALASRFGITAYDARYLGIAMALGAPLVTEDRRLRKAAPALTRSLAEAVAAE